MGSQAPNEMEILGEQECMRLLGSCQVGRLAISIMNVPDVFPVNFVVDRGTVVFRTAEGTKLAGAVLGSGVAFEVDGVDRDTGHAWAVVLKGQAAEIEAMGEVFDALELPLVTWHEGYKHRFVRIMPAEITGRRFHISPNVDY